MKKIFKRKLEDRIKPLLFKGKAILIFGPRQAGKTTLAKKIVEEYGEKGLYLNCELMDVRSAMQEGRPELLKNLIGNKKIVVLDEAQTVMNIGFILKVFIDTYKDVQIIATGSSSFDLANKINEPLTGRSFEFTLYPLSTEEIELTTPTKDKFFELLRLGNYPSVVAENDKDLAINILRNITTNYLYKDIYIFENIKNPTIFENLLKLLAHQIGQMVSVNELSKTLGISRLTVDKYLRLLEQSYVIKRVNSFNTNQRNELKKSFKIYFIDLGVRNAVIDSFGLVEDRADKGFLFENYIFMELLKRESLDFWATKIYFWRTKEQIEVDFVLNKNEEIKAYECKWSNQEVVFNKFLALYSKAKTKVISMPEYCVNYKDIFGFR